jgi:pyruvate dehydrogenase E2 component (dihydrolipoamide acetyltransferase)
VRRLAESLGVALGAVQGSGPGGRILQEDVERAARGGSPQSHVAAPTEQPQLLPWSPTRRAIARKTQASAREIPHFYLVMDVDASALLKARERLRAAGAAPSVNDLLLHATGQILPRHPQVNAHHSDAGLLTFPHAHIAVAVATPEGVLAPVLRHADRLSLAQLTTEVAGLRERAAGRRLAEGELDGASFTVSNLGMYGIREFTSIISAPQCASMAVGTIRDAGSAKVLTLTLSCDHRAIDGATGAAFLRDLRDAIEAL